MEKVNLSLSFVVILTVAFLLCFVPRSSAFNSTDGEKRVVPNVWCIANPEAGPGKLLLAIRFCCSQAGVNCAVFKQGGPCFNPDTLPAHASVALNLYFKASGSVREACWANGYGVTTFQNPSSGTCIYP